MIILGFVFFATMSVFGIIDFIIKFYKKNEGQ
jgi:hypothetical protein